MTVTGLATVNLSGLTGWQQVILYLQMIAGNIVGRALEHWFTFNFIPGI